MSEWFCQIEGAESGPFAVEELQFLRGRGKLTKDSLVRRATDTRWQSARTIPGLFKKQRTNGPVSPAPTSLPLAVQKTDIVPANTSAEPQASEPDSQLVPSPRTVPTAPLPPQRDDRQAQQRRRRIVLGILIGCGVVALILLLLLLFVTVGQVGVGEIADGGNGGSPGAGGLGAGQESLTADAGPDSEEIGNSNSPAPVENAGEKEETSSEEVPPEVQQAGNLFELAALNQPVAEASAPAPSSSNVGGGVLGGGRGGGAGGASEFFGVKVRGKIALVCDISGSMSADFPVLVKELREKFPKNTPLILVGGCVFSPPNPGAPPPQKLIDLGQQSHYIGGGLLADDPHAYLAMSTTDAIIFAVETLKRDTVMFNNDLQDGGSEQAITAFEQLRRKRRFTLSGRSLNCEAPTCLLNFIKSSGGDFKVDPISRSPLPARPWTP